MNEDEDDARGVQVVENDEEEAAVDGALDEGGPTAGADASGNGGGDSDPRSRRRLSSSSLQPPRQRQRQRLPLLSVRHVGKLMPTVQDLRSHRDWRLREWAVAVVPLLHAASATVAPAAEDAPLSPLSPISSSSSSSLSPASSPSDTGKGSANATSSTDTDSPAAAAVAALENASISSGNSSIRSTISIASDDARAQATTYRAQLLEVLCLLGHLSL